MVIEADELWSFVGSKGPVQWVWVALDAGNRRVLAMAPGDRTAATAKRLWGALPRGYRTGVTVYTDVLASYRAAIPRARHRAVGKDTGRTAHIERFWLTRRQRCARFVRKTLTFSKCHRNHLGALWYFCTFREVIGFTRRDRGRVSVTDVGGFFGVVTGG